MHGVLGSGYYCAPEVIHGDYSEKSDVFSIGVIFFMILSGQAPFQGANSKDVLDAILKGAYSMTEPVWSHVSEGAKDLIKQMLCR
jgi:calcium-dependent protein kinase